MPDHSGELLARLERGDLTAADDVVERYASRLLALARSRLSARIARRIDAEDVVQSTYRSFFVRAQDGQFTAEREGDLWRLLATITLHKLSRQVRHHQAAKRSMNREAVAGDGNAVDLAQLVDREPSAADVVTVAEEVHWLLSQFEPLERQAIELRLQGQTFEEIAAGVGRSERTVRRWLSDAGEILQRRWERESRAPDPEVVRSSMPAPAAVSELVAPLNHADYHLGLLIGSGGVCKVYAAEHRATKQPVAVKVFRKRLRNRPSLVARFVNEAQIVARLNHPRIVRVHGIGRLPDDGYFMVMDFIEGGDLAALAARQPISAAQAAAIVADVADAIQHAHDRGVIHRDLKPGNVLIDRSGKIYVTDFGFASTNDIVAGSELADGHNEAIVGTVGFMAPEQIDSTLGPIGPHTDVYGLGALLFALLEGRPPQAGTALSESLAA